MNFRFGVFTLIWLLLLLAGVMIIEDRGGNAMTKTELKSYYREQLSQGQFSHSGGAGLGFADILRKSREKITYSFESVNEDYSYFSLQVKILA